MYEEEGLLTIEGLPLWALISIIVGALLVAGGVGL
jgi:hypothetical protein